MGGAGLYSTVIDYLRFTRMLLAGGALDGARVLDRSTVDMEGRQPGSLAWAGLANTYYWVDPTSQVTGVFVTQVLPFFDEAALLAFSSFERSIYDEVTAI